MSTEVTDHRKIIKQALADHDAATLLHQIRQMLRDDPKPHEVSFCATSIARASAEIQQQLGAQTLRLFVVRSVTLEPLVPHLTVQAALSNFLLDIRLGGFGSYADDLMNPGSPLAGFSPHLVLVHLDLEDIAGQLPDLCSTGTGQGVAAEVESSIASFGQMLQSFRSRSTAKMIVQGMVVPDHTSLGDVADANLSHSLPEAVQDLNRGIAALCRTLPDCIFFDVDRVAARVGRSAWRDERLFLSSRLPLSANAFLPYARSLLRSISAMLCPPRKVLCTDLDNTFWGGILGEDGTDGIATGATFPGSSYLLYQQYLKQLSTRGILLAIVSKNNEADVREAFEVRAADLALRLDDFVALKINWNDKAQSIREIAEELSLGLDSFVFVDDNPVECEAILQRLPGVAVLAAPLQEPWTILKMLTDAALFDAIAVTADDANRVAEYKAQSRRTALASSAGSHEDFLASLGIVCTFSSALTAPLARSVQLLAKTNQFNLTTRRHSSTDVEAFAAAPGGQAVVVRVRDRFGDAGVVGLALARMEGKACFIDSFLLSCRVIGRGIETALLAHLAANALQHGAEKVRGEFIPSRKNSLCSGFYTAHAFTPSSAPHAAAPESQFFELDLTHSVPQIPPWIHLEDTADHELTAPSLVAS